MKNFIIILALPLLLSGCLDGGIKSIGSFTGSSESETHTYAWTLGNWGGCSATACGTNGTQLRIAVCRDENGADVADSFCLESEPKPATSQACSAPSCTSTYTWLAGAWSACSVTACGSSGAQNRTVVCKRNDNATVADSFCSSAGVKPAASQGCSTAPCTGSPISFIFDKRIINIPFSGSYPVRASKMTDPVTGFGVTRFGDKSDLTGDYGGSRPSMSLIVYSRYTPTNTTGEFVLVHGDNSTSAWIYRTSTNTMTTILRMKPSLGTDSRSLGELNELRWDYSGQHPYRLYFVGRSISNSQAVGTEKVGMSFYYTDINPTTGAQSQPVLIRDFNADFPNATNAEIMNDVEGDSSTDSRYWAWMVMNTSLSSGNKAYGVFVYDKTNNTILGKLQQTCAGTPAPCVTVTTPATAAPYISKPNMVEMSPRGTRVILNWGRAYAGSRDADIGTVADGPKGFLPNFTDPIRIGADETHSGWAWGPNGEEMFVYQNNRNDYIEAVNILNATTANCTVISSNNYTCGTKILPYTEIDENSWSLGMHFGRVYDQNKKGWLYMNTYDSGFSKYGRNQNLLVEIKPWTASPRVLRLGSTYNDYYDYRSEGSGALDFQGNTIWTTGNWGFKDGRGDAIKLELPTDWFQQLQSR